MAEGVAEPAVAEEQVATTQRPARALLGWLPEEQGRLTLTGREDRSLDPEREAKLGAARAAVEDRAAGVDQSGLVQDAPAELNPHVAALQANVKSTTYFAEGWTVRVVDLTRVCAVQPLVFVDHAVERVDCVDPSDITSIASVSLPVADSAPLRAQFNTVNQAWVFNSPNPNLRIVGQFRGQVENRHHTFGFVVDVSSSFLQVARFQGRYLLRDGYHRAYGFLARGIARVPAFVREFSTIEELRLPSGMLPQDAYLGDRPPLLSDYFDEAVSVETSAPATQKLVMIQGLEISTLG